MNKIEKAIIIEKRVECILGILFLIPSVLGVIFFLINLFGGEGDLIELSKLGGEWGAWVREGGASMSPAPVFIGLMAIAGVLLIKNSLRYLLYKEKKERDC